MKKQKTTILLIGLMLLTTFGALTAFADDNQDATAAMWINYVLCKIANLIFLIVGAVAALVIILAGLKWLTSGDDPGARNAAKTAIVSAFVGIIIIFVAVFVVWWVVSGLLPEKAQGVDPTIWVTGSCESLKTGMPTTGGGTTGGGTTNGGTPSSGIDFPPNIPTMACDAACRSITDDGATKYPNGGQCLQIVGGDPKKTCTDTAMAESISVVVSGLSDGKPCENEGVSDNVCCCTTI